MASVNDTVRLTIYNALSATFAPIIAAGNVISTTQTWDDLAACFASGTYYSQPAKEVVYCNLSASETTDTAKFDGTGLGTGTYIGWAICNGNNNTPNLSLKFVRSNCSGSATTGGEDSNSHTHGFTPVGTNANHSHGLTAAGVALEAVGGTGFISRQFTNGTSWNATHQETNVTVATNATTGITTTTGLVGTTDTQVSLAWTGTAGTTGTPSDTENRPAYYELVPLMRV